MGAAAFAVAIAVSVMVTIVVVRHSSPPRPGLASARDSAPISVITEEPTCGGWSSVAHPLAASEKASGWHDRDKSIPASAWSAQLSAQYRAAGTAIREAADKTGMLARQTPHRVVRELYEQLIAYWRAYADRIPQYTSPDDLLLRVTYSAGNAIFAICDAIRHGAAALRGPLVTAAAPPTNASPHTDDPANPQRFLRASNSICADFTSVFAHFNDAAAAWHDTDEDIPASQWSPQQRALNDGIRPAMSAVDDELDRLGRRSGNPVMEDFAVLTAVYGRAYVEALPTYVVADHYLYDVTAQGTSLISTGCKAV
ncbi:hypothetical protein BN973_05750 [Mycobacterium triplex]|uniref:Uncharacterized protein n=4 Tax=Mycobacterium TaxID=1763 RepID=A0A024K779_9MYCO|nr:hypothetical protein BN973_05750 [Mycobacterium triplex]